MGLVNVLSSDALGRITKQVPFIEGAEVVFYGDVPGAFIQEMEQLQKDLGDREAGYAVTVKTIADWNFCDEKNEKLAVSVDVLKRLPVRLQKWIFEESTGALLPDSAKKKELPAN